MPVRKTESRLPAGTTIADLGQSTTVNTSIHLVSYLSAPIAIERLQTYFVFVTDSSVAATVATYAWTITDAAVVTNPVTTEGTIEYTPQNTGTLSVSVQLKDAGSNVIATVALSQTVVVLNAALEALVDQQDNNIPSAAHPATSREVVNDLRMYADPLLPPATDDLFNKMLLSTGYAAAMATQQVQRNYQLESYANLLNTGRHADFLSATEKGIGICKVRPQVLAMFLDKTPGNPYIAYTELPASGATVKTVLTTIQDNFNALSENDKIDLFNLMRFPKSSYKMAKLIYEKLKDKYFTSSTIPQILGVKADAQKLVQQYEVGPVAVAGVAAASTFAKAVFNIMQQAVWGIAILPVAGTATPSNPGGAAAAPFGSPEHVPDLTFVAKARDDDNGFIRTAFLYHDTYGLNPVTIESFEDLVAKLSQANTHISRMRLVSHFYIDPQGKHDSNMYMPFFTPAAQLAASDNTRFTIKDYFNFGISDAAGLAGFAADSIAITPGHPTDGTPLPVAAGQEKPFMKVILDKVRAADPNILVPFSLQGANTSPSGDLAEFIKYCCDKYFFNHAENVFEDPTNAMNVLDMPPEAVTALTDFVDTKIEEKKTKLVATGKSGSDLDALAAKIDAIPLNSFFGNLVNLGTFTIKVNKIFMNNHSVFQSNLVKVKSRFDSTSIIDIRGCRIGQDTGFLDAVRNFFGNPGSLPIVTAPEWYQSFTFMGWGLPVTEAHVDSYFNSGLAGTFVAADIQREYANWGGRLGIPSHISFWLKLATGDPFDFLAFQWKNNIPGLSISAVKVKDLGTLGFTAALQRLGEIFNIAASLPAPASMQTFETTIIPQMAKLKTAADNAAVMTASTPVSDLDPVNTAIQEVATALSQTLPPPANPMTLAYINASLQTLKTYVTGQLAVAPFLTAMAAKLNAPTAGWRYLQFIGLPLPVQSASSETNFRLIMLDGLKDNAAKSWIKAQWAEAVPGAAALDALAITWSPPDFIIANSPSTKNDDDLTSLGKMLQVAALLVDHAGKETAINPTYEYQTHIKSTI